jgi:Mu DNA-binding domain
MSVSEIAKAQLPGVPKTKPGLCRLMKLEKWVERHNSAGRSLRRPRKGRGGGWEWHVSLLPKLAQVALIKRHAHGTDLTSLENLQVRMRALETEMRAVRVALRVIEREVWPS